MLRLRDAFTEFLDERFGRGMWHTVYSLKPAFGTIDGGLCFCCHELAVRRCLVNTWGVICEYDLCEAHADRYDGKNVDEVEKRPGTACGAEV